MVVGPRLDWLGLLRTPAMTILDPTTGKTITIVVAGSVVTVER
jgi:hypothetical protein